MKRLFLALSLLASPVFALPETKEQLFADLNQTLISDPDFEGMKVSLCIEDLCTEVDRTETYRNKKPDASGKGETALSKMVDTIMRSTGGQAKLEIKYKQGADGSLEWSIIVEGGWGSGAGGGSGSGFEHATSKQIK